MIAQAAQLRGHLQQLIGLGIARIRLRRLWQWKRGSRL